MPDTEAVGSVPTPGATNATRELLLLQIPPETESVTKMLLPWHKIESPMIGLGNACTVTIAVVVAVAQELVIE